MTRSTPSRTRRVVPLLLALAGATPVQAFDILGVQNSALDQPQVYGQLFDDPNAVFQAFVDTGASGVILSEDTADMLGVQRQSAGGPPPQPLVLFEDVGVGGTAKFNVSAPLTLKIAPITPLVDPFDPTAYTQSFGPLRTQIGPFGVPLLGGVDVVGMPTMTGKVLVIDPKPLNALVMFLKDPSQDPAPNAGFLQTYIYNPGTAFNPATAGFDPGIPATNRNVALTHASFDRFTQVTPAGAEGPTLHPNPFVGPNPLAKIDPTVPAGTVPGVTLTLGDRQTTGSFLLDTGAAASIISIEQAAHLNVRYRPGVPDTEPPVLELFDPAHPELPGQALQEQFLLTLGGIGGEVTAAGFFVDSLLVRTREGNVLNDLDPAHLRYLRAPVLVFDISLKDPVTGDVLTLDGLFAMSLLVATMDAQNFPFGELGLSAFNWIVFDQAAGILGLDVAAIPEPGTWAMMFAGLVLLAFVARRRVRRA
jgi:hypothetical protein